MTPPREISIASPLRVLQQLLKEGEIWWKAAYTGSVSLHSKNQSVVSEELGTNCSMRRVAFYSNEDIIPHWFKFKHVACWLNPRALFHHTPMKSTSCSYQYNKFTELNISVFLLLCNKICFAPRQAKVTSRVKQGLDLSCFMTSF